MSIVSRTFVSGVGLSLAAVVWLHAEHAPPAVPHPVRPVASHLANRDPRAPRAQGAGAQAAAPAPDRVGVDGALIEKYCVTCHSERAKRGGLVLEKIDVSTVGANAELWEKVIRKLRSREMPPNGSPAARRGDLHGLCCGGGERARSGGAG